MTEEKLITTETPFVIFEDNPIGRMKKELWDASDAEIDVILSQYGVPAPLEWTKVGSYIQTTARHTLIENRRKNDIVFIPVGCTENHGMHMASYSDTLYVSAMAEGVRRYTAKSGAPCNIALPPLMYGGHPYHHIGMPGTVVVRDEVVIGMMVDVMLGLWNDGFRKQIILNNHGHLWLLEAAIHQFTKKYQLPGYFRVIDWHRAVREFFVPKSLGGKDFVSNFVHADESETSFSLLCAPESVDMEYAVDTDMPTAYFPGGHMDTSVDPYGRPSRWSEAEGHIAIEIHGSPEGVVGLAAQGTAQKAKRPMAAILRYLTLLHDEILEAYPAGKVPPVETTTLRDAADMAPYLLEPQSPGWKSVYGLPQIGQIQ
jgi:creatinine amidohydrolase/Fe(II)-dependent formamide hydrolase-like protein